MLSHCDFSISLSKFTFHKPKPFRNNWFIHGKKYWKTGGGELAINRSLKNLKSQNLHIIKSYRPSSGGFGGWELKKITAVVFEVVGETTVTINPHQFSLNEFQAKNEYWAPLKKHFFATSALHYQEKFFWIIFIVIIKNCTFNIVLVINKWLIFAEIYLIPCFQKSNNLFGFIFSEVSSGLHM